MRWITVRHQCDSDTCQLIDRGERVTAQQENIEARQLLQRYCSESDQSAFERFYRGHAARLWRFLRARGVGEDAAYDLLSESFLRFIQVICRDLRTPLALLYRIAVNLHIDTWRRDRTAHLASSGDTPASESATAPPADEHEYLRQLIARLPDSEQNLLLMRYWIGLTHKEIAALLELPEGTVRRRAATLLNELKQQWEDDQA